eukprot:scaffold24912_cov19-Tisochrysis_lutea.AAC.3
MAAKRPRALRKVLLLARVSPKGPLPLNAKRHIPGEDVRSYGGVFRKPLMSRWMRGMRRSSEPEI